MDNKSSYAAVYEGGHDNADDFNAGVTKMPLKGNGDFRSDECIEYLKPSDIVVTNPPFSLARAYVAELKKYDKKFIIIGDLNWITYKEIFPLIEENQLWLGYTKVKEFKQPDGTYKKFGNKLWFTNVNIKKRYHKLETAYRWHKHKEKYPDLYPKYDNYDAIEVSKVSQIPLDYDGAMGVPITFLDKFNPDQFEIIKFRKGNDNKDLRYMVNNKLKYPYCRILIKNKYPEKYQNDL